MGHGLRGMKNPFDPCYLPLDPKIVNKLQKEVKEGRGKKK